MGLQLKKILRRQAGMGKYVNESSFEVAKETAKRISEVRHGK